MGGVVFGGVGLGVGVGVGVAIRYDNNIGWGKSEGMR